jgi:hypothetical protein
MVRAYVLPGDNFEWISARLRDFNQPNAAFGDSHVAAVPDFNKKDFVNLGIGATTIRRMNDRVRYYFGKTTPGQVIIQADPHLFAEYRLEAQGSYVPEAYSNLRLRILDPRHRGFMQKYWVTLLTNGQLKEKESTSYDQLWETVTHLPAKPAPSSPPAEGTVSPTADAPATVAPTTAPPVAVSPTETAPAAHAPTTAPTTDAAAPTKTAPAAAGATSAPPAAADVAVEATKKADDVTLSKFNAFMDYEVTTHTPAPNFQQRDEARIYVELIQFLVAQGAKVCLMNYPVDRHYRELADRIPAYADARKFYVELARANHIPYVSFWDRFDDPSMYQNTDHVNQNGSPILAREARQACFGTPAS